MDEKDLVISIARELESKKAENIVVLYIGEETIIADYFIICTGRSSLHIHSLVDDVEEFTLKLGRVPLHVEGERGSRWILMDYGDIVVHIFNREGREFYALDRLWGGAKIVPYKETEVNGNEGSQQV